MIDAMKNVMGLYKTTLRSNTPVKTRGCSPVLTHFVSEHKVENHVGLMSQNTMLSRVMFMGMSPTLRNERL